MVVAGAAGGAAWAADPGVLRAFFKTNEIITSLMLNYVAAYLLTYLIFNSESYWRETDGFNAKVFPTGKALPDSAIWPAMTIPTLARGSCVPLGAGLAVLSRSCSGCSTRGRASASRCRCSATRRAPRATPACARAARSSR